MQQWTFFEYLQRLSQCSSPPEEALPVTAYVEKRLLLKESPTLSYVLDYRTGRYGHFSRNSRQLTGFDRELFLSEGIHFTIQQHNRQDAEVYFNTIFPRRLQFLHKLDPENHMYYSFQHSFRFQHKDQHFVTFLQETKILKSDKVGPLVVLGYWTDITPFKEDTRITDVIKYTKPDEPQQLVEVNHYYPKSPESLLSVRELEILKLVVEGKSSEAIAEKLHISRHTVLTHRTHIREKTKAKNVADLLRYANTNNLF